MKDLILQFNDDQYASTHDTAQDDTTALTHHVSKRDAALVIGISCLEAFKKDYVSGATENDVHSMQDLFIDQLGLKPSSVQTLSHLSTLKPTTKNINKYMNSTIKKMKKHSALFIYISGPCWVKNKECFIPTQDYNKKGAHDFGIYMTNYEKLIQECKASYVIMILDCDNAEEFSRPLIETCRDINKHLYVICSSQNFGRSLADEKILKHGYLTFFLKFYLKRLKSSTLSLRELVHFLKRYTTPLSRFAYHPLFKQGDQTPTLIHRVDKQGEVEIDGLLTSKSSTVAKWSELLRTTRTYRDWLTSRAEDAERLLGDTLFSKTQLLVHLYLTALKSFALLLFEYDKIHLMGSELDEDNLDILSDVIVELLTDWVEGIAHVSHDKWDSYEGLEGVDKKYVMVGLRQGSEMVAKQIKVQTLEHSSPLLA